MSERRSFELSLRALRALRRIYRLRSHKVVNSQSFYATHIWMELHAAGLIDIGYIGPFKEETYTLNDRGKAMAILLGERYLDAL